MIESIRVAKVATYGEAQGDLVGLSTFNYIYGPNAAGKTTLSNLIGNPSEPSFSSCQINWKAGAPLQTLVYNRNFIERNFNPSSQLKGIFTLGEENIETLEAIKKAKEKRDELDGKVVALTVTLNGPDGNGGKEEDLRKVRDRLKEQCWSQKKKHDAQFQLAFSTYGVRADSEKFLGQFLIENNSNTATLEKFETLAEKAKTVFGKTPLAEPLLPILNSASSLLAHESNAILTKHVVGRDDVDIAAMIKKLGNSDWVKEGWGYFKVNDEHCPFCQQVTPQTLHQSLSEYFDETFVADTKAIIDMQSSFEADSNSIHSVLTGLLTSPSAFLDDEKLAELHKLFDAKRTVNLQKIAGKVKEPSSVIQLDSLDDVLKGAAAVIEDANLRIAKHNEMVLDITKERQTLVSQIWKYLLEVELKQELADYTKDSSSLLLAITALKEKIKIMSQERVAADLEIQGLEKKTTSTQPAVDAINKTLKSFNFRSFQIAQAESNTYRLVRADGSEAKETLSEGERTFVTFLYFYNLLKGSDSESGMTVDRVVVFDDPVSSLDSDILFIVSSLIREVIAEVRNGVGLIKQVFVLTHNVYFHKEVTYCAKRSQDSCLKEETFWTVRKRDLVSEIIGHKGNPIKTSYELLWHDVRKPESAGLGIQNTLRRIIESYFKILGGVDKEDLLANFDGQEKILCASLLSWVNDGSHGVHDDVFVAADQLGTDVYLEVFHRIFEQGGHEGHYKMMMGDCYSPLKPLVHN